jgi:putative Mn2+ efflux pump MntP
MAPQQTIIRISKSIAGAILVGLGMFSLYENVHGAVARLSHTLGANGSQALGLLPAVFLALSQTMQAYAVNHQRFFEALLQQILVSSWPLLLVICGTVLSGDTLRGESKLIQTQPVDLPPPAQRMASPLREARG